MKNKVFIFFIFIGLVGLIFHPACKTAEETSQYTLTVTVGDGVNGTPATGTYAYSENDVVTYSYSARTGYGNLTVTLDGAAIANSGVITMSGNHNLNVTADLDIRGKWIGNIYWMGNDYYFEVTFSGGLLSGTTKGYTEAPTGPGSEEGEFTITNDQIEFTLHYYGGDLLFNGTINNENHMNGTWDTSTATASGNWELSR